MKYIILGLGTFGASLAEKLALLGHEVLGVDSRMDKVDAIKEKIAYAFCMDCTDKSAVSGLPLRDTDAVIVAIGEDKGANIMATALMKQLNVKRLISRAVSPLQETVLKAMDVEEIIYPEQETAGRWANNLTIYGVINSFDISEEYSIVEMKVPPVFAGKTLGELDLKERYHITVVTIIKVTTEKNLLGKVRKTEEVQDGAYPETRLGADDIIVLYGKRSDFRKLFD